MEAALVKDFGYLQSGLLPLDGNARLKLLHGIYHMDRPGDFQLDLNTCILNARDWRNEFPPVSMKFEPACFHIGDKWLKADCLAPGGYPSSLSDA